MDKTEIANYFPKCGGKENEVCEYVTIDGEGVKIDKSMVSLIKMMNNKFDITTRSCCSGVLSEHIDLDKFSEKVAIDDIKVEYGRPPNGYMLQKRPLLITDTFLHNFSAVEKEVEVAPQFYTMLSNNLSVEFSENPHTVDWKIDIRTEVDLSDEPFNHTDYVFELTLQSKRALVMNSDTYKEYDRRVRKCIQHLEKVIEDTLKDSDYH